jgi:hypothetical protein
LTRISMAPGGATSTSSITSACPGPHATAAAHHQTGMSQEKHARKHSCDGSEKSVTSAGDGRRRGRGGCSGGHFLQICLISRLCRFWWREVKQSSLLGFTLIGGGLGRSLPATYHRCTTRQH